jgi:hypothetical protein
MQGKIGFSGSLTARKITPPGPGLLWKARNLRHLWPGLWRQAAARAIGVAAMKGTLRARLFRANGEVVDYGLISCRLVTDAFVEFMVDQLQAETSQWGDFKFHDSGIGVTGANVSDTDIETTDNEARATGSQTEGATYKSVGTITYSGALAITEHGLFSQAAGTTLMDRHTFAAINVVNADSIEFTFELTCTSGG